MSKTTFIIINAAIALFMTIFLGSFGIWVYSQLNSLSERTIVNSQALMDSKDIQNEQKKILYNDIVHLEKNVQEIKTSLSVLDENMDQLHKDLFQLSIKINKNR